MGKTTHYPGSGSSYQNSRATVASGPSATSAHRNHRAQEKISVASFSTLLETAGQEPLWTHGGEMASEDAAGGPFLGSMLSRKAPEPPTTLSVENSTLGMVHCDSFPVPLSPRLHHASDIRRCPEKLVLLHRKCLQSHFFTHKKI